MQPRKEDRTLHRRSALMPRRKEKHSAIPPTIAPKRLEAKADERSGVVEKIEEKMIPAKNIGRFIKAAETRIATTLPPVPIPQTGREQMTMRRRPANQATAQAIDYQISRICFRRARRADRAGYPRSIQLSVGIHIVESASARESLY